jgi:hypothetical protein
LTSPSKLARSTWSRRTRRSSVSNADWINDRKPKICLYSFL